jgi:hypothetical protein
LPSDLRNNGKKPDRFKEEHENLTSGLRKNTRNLPSDLRKSTENVTLYLKNRRNVTSVPIKA